MSNKYIDVERSLMRFCVLVACEKRLCVCATSGTEEKTIDFVELEDEVKKSIAEQNAIFEVSKYPVKDTDVIRGNKVTPENIQTVKYLDKALTYKRLTSYGGLLKEIHKELQLSDA